MTFTLNVSNREHTGSRKSRNYIKNNQVPAVIYGKGIENINILVCYNAIKNIADKNQLTKESKVLLCFNDKNIQACFHAIKIDSLTRKIIHIDFYTVK